MSVFGDAIDAERAGDKQSRDRFKAMIERERQQQQAQMVHETSTGPRFDPGLFVHDAVQGATLGFADEEKINLEAKKRMFEGDTRPYEEIQQELRDQYQADIGQRAEQAIPGQRGVAQLGGGLATSGLGTARLLATKPFKQLPKAVQKAAIPVAGGVEGGRFSRAVRPRLQPVAQADEPAAMCDHAPRGRSPGRRFGDA